MRETNIVPQVNQIEVHPYFNQQEVQDFCDKHDIVVTAWMPLMRNRGLLDDPTITKLAKAYDKTPAQIVSRGTSPHPLKHHQIAEIDSLNRNARQGKDPDEVSIGDLK